MHSRPDLLKLIYPDVEPDLFEPNTYTVASKVKSSKRGPYRVVLDEYQWNGWCSCQDFEFRKQPHLEHGALPSDNLRCTHIKRARSYRLDEVGPMIDAAMKRNSKDQSRVYYLKRSGPVTTLGRIHK